MLKIHIWLWFQIIVRGFHFVIFWFRTEMTPYTSAKLSPKSQLSYSEGQLTWHLSTLKLASVFKHKRQTDQIMTDELAQVKSHFKRQSDSLATSQSSSMLTEVWNYLEHEAQLNLIDLAHYYYPLFGVFFKNTSDIIFILFIVCSNEEIIIML